MDTKHNSTRFRRLSLLIIIGMLLALVALPGASASSKRTLGSGLLNHLSQSVVLKYWMANPDQAPPDLQERFRNIKETRSSQSRLQAPGTRRVEPFNNDQVGYPQNE